MSDKKEPFVKKLHLACSDEEARPQLQCIYIKDGWAIAANPHMIVKQKLETHSTINRDQIPKLEGKFIHKNVWEQLVGCTEILVENDTLVCQNDAGKVIYQFAFHTTLFPDIETILDNFKPEMTTEISLNTKYLQTLSKVFDSNSLKMEFSSSKGAMIKPVVGEDEFAYLAAIFID